MSTDSTINEYTISGLQEAQNYRDVAVGSSDTYWDEYSYRGQDN